MIQGEEIPEGKLALMAKEDKEAYELRRDIVERLGKLKPAKRQEVFKEIYGAPLPTTHAYYHERYALQLLPDLEMMKSYIDAEKKCVLFYDYNDYPQWKPKTLWMYINDGFRYAAEFLDKENWIKNLRDLVIVSQGSDGVRISFKSFKTPYIKAKLVLADDPLAIDPNNIVNQRTVSEEKGIILPDNQQYRQELMEWMEGSTKGQSFMRDISLNEDDVSYLTVMFETDEIFGLSINKEKTRFKVVRLE